jgi:hypothetical protein
MSTVDRKRHGCLTIWLLLLVLWNLALILTYTGCNMVEWVGNTGEPFGWYYPIMTGLAVLSLISIFALFRWKKWGFWVLLVINAFKLALEVAVGSSDFMVLAGIVVTMLILVGVLNMGRENKGWPQLR